MGKPEVDFEEFVRRAKIKHGDKFVYHKESYVNMSIRTKVTCRVHGDFMAVPYHHTRSSGCAKCSREKSKRTATGTTQKFIKKSYLLHGDKYDYSMVVYRNNKTKVDIICPIHGVFSQTPNNHLSGYGCPECGKSRIGDIKRKSIDILLEEFQEVHEGRYDYSQVNYVDAHTDVKIICKKHGAYWQRPIHHRYGHGCPKCAYSNMEYFVDSILKTLLIKYKAQKKFKDCMDVGLLPFDFYLPEYNTLIECQGKQHYEAIEFFGGEEGFLDRQKKDKIKKDFALKNGYNFLEVRYDMSEEEIFDYLLENIEKGVA